MTPEHNRLLEAERREKYWRRWGPYLSERQWGTVREDYSANGDAWGFIPFESAHQHVYRWGEDGLGGISDNRQRLCFALALWNERDPILKERLFGLANGQGNHGEDVKELYYYLDATPTHSYLKFLYKYPQAEFPYNRLRSESQRRGRHDPEFELIDTGIFDEDRYFDVLLEVAKADVEDLLFRITVTNRGPEASRIHVLPTLWFRNTWRFGLVAHKPVAMQTQRDRVRLTEESLGDRDALFGHAQGQAPRLLFTDNESNAPLLFGLAADGSHFKDAFHRYVVNGEAQALRSDGVGTKCAAHYVLEVEPGASEQICVRLCPAQDDAASLGTDFHETIEVRRQEADAFYHEIAPPTLDPDSCLVQRQAFAGLIWSKQFYCYVVNSWLKGDPGMPSPPPGRDRIRNTAWQHFFANDILSMPDKWEYPWFAAWDSAFHMISFALIDSDFAKSQLKLFLREWYMHPNGQLPAYEWNFSDVNPPVHAWSVWRVFQIDRKQRGTGDYAFLEGCFHKLMVNFTWWINRKDSLDNNIFEGGFLGLDNIGLFDRNRTPLAGGVLEQSDGTGWMAMYCLNMMRIACELALRNPVYEDIASKFFEHFLYISHAIAQPDDAGLWDDQDGFFYDVLRFPDHTKYALKIRSLVGLLPLLAVDTLDANALEKLPNFAKRLNWFVRHRPDLTSGLASMVRGGQEQRRLLSICDEVKLRRVLTRMLDTNEFLSDHGIRSLSRAHNDNQFCIRLGEDEHCIQYEPAESQSGMFGGNSNWRGPVWFPTNYLLIESLQKFHHYFGEEFLIEFPTGSGQKMNLSEVAGQLSRRLSRLFLLDEGGTRPAMRHHAKFMKDPQFRDHLLFHEYFHGDTGLGLGASHQTGWTSLVAKLLQQSGS